MSKTDNRKNNSTARMEYLFNLLHEEWSHSGNSTKLVLVRKCDTDRLVSALIENVGIMLEMGDNINDFKQGIEMAHDMHIMYRMAEKVRKRAEKVKAGTSYRNNMNLYFDKEEYKMFCNLAKDHDIDFWEM